MLKLFPEMIQKFKGNEIIFVKIGTVIMKIILVFQHVQIYVYYYIMNLFLMKN